MVLVYQEVTKLKKNDNIFQFARRHYDNEIKLLINFKKYLKHKKILKLKINPPRLRMPKNLERKVLLKFKSIKYVYVNDTITEGQNVYSLKEHYKSNLYRHINNSNLHSTPRRKPEDLARDCFARERLQNHCSSLPQSHICARKCVNHTLGNSI